MYQIRLRVETNNIDPFVDILQKRYSPKYSEKSIDTYIFCAEKARILPSSVMTLLIVFRQQENVHLIDIIGTGGGHGAFGNDMGTEASQTRKIANLFVDYCNGNGIKGAKEMES